MLRATRSIVLAVCLAGCGAFLGLGEGEEDDGSTTPAADASADGILEGGAPDATKDASADADADADAGPTNPDACNGKLSCERYVFVTSIAYPGSFQAATANDKCKARAESAAASAALKGRSWRAWISTSDTSTASMNVGAAGTLRYKLVNDVTVADDFVDLVDGSLDHAIDRDETDEARTNVLVWTGTAANGTYGGASCNGFTSPSEGTAKVGDTGQTSGGWSNAGEHPCSMEARLYCFEY